MSPKKCITIAGFAGAFQALPHFGLVNDLDHSFVEPKLKGNGD